MIKQILATTIVLGTLSIVGYASDVNMPGADKNISEDAYKTYVYVPNSTLAKRSKENSNIINTLKSTGGLDKIKKYRHLETDEAALESLKYDLSQDMSFETGKTEFVFHDVNSGIQFTVPFSLVKKYYNSLDEAEYTGASGDVYIRRYESSDVARYPLVSFTYPGLTNAGYWDFSGDAINSESNNNDIVGVTFSVPQHSRSFDLSIRANGTDSETQSIQLDNSILSNYVVPSIRLLSNLDESTHTVIYKNIQFRVLNGTVQKKYTDEDILSGAKSEGLQFKGIPGVTQTLHLVPLKNNREYFLLSKNPDDPYNFKSHVNYIEGLFMNTLYNDVRLVRMDKSMVWLDGVPAMC